MKTKLIISVLAFIALTTMAAAQNNGVDQRPRNEKRNGLTYVDKNGNSICDNYENRNASFQRGNRNGKCRWCTLGQNNSNGQMGWRHGKGNKRNFVDSDKNGVCDYYEAASNKGKLN
jgi:hypothetical protein